MKTLDFIRSNIGSKVYLTPDGDLMMNGELKPLIREKQELILTKLTKGGMAIVTDKNGNEYSVPPKNVREINYI